MSTTVTFMRPSGGDMWHIHKRTVVSCVPRIGETVIFTDDENKVMKFTAADVEHSPDDNVVRVYLEKPQAKEAAK